MVAIRTDSTLGTNFTQATLSAAIKAAMTSAGFSGTIDDYTSATDRYLVYSFVTDATKTYGTVYYRIRISTAFIIYCSIYSSWNSTLRTGNNASSEITFAGLTTANTINFVSLNGGIEYKIVLITQTATFIPLGIISPSNKPNWWNLNQWNYAFFWSSPLLSIVTGSTLNPYGSTAYSFINNDNRMSNANLQTGTSDILTGLILTTSTARGIVGKTSEDLGSACVSASSRYNTIPSDTVNQDYLIINPVSGGLVIKVQS